MKCVSDDHWDDKDAQVVCRMLGLNHHGAKATSSSHFGRVQVNFAMDDLKCSGTERGLNDCPHNPRHNCGTHEGAGVRCHDKGKENVLVWLPTPKSGPARPPLGVNVCFCLSVCLS